MKNRKKIIIGIIILVLVIVLVVSIYHPKQKSITTLNNNLTISTSTTTNQQDETTLCRQNRWQELQKEKIIATFADYPVNKIYSGSYVSVDYKSSFIATRYRTWVKEAVKNDIEFAGHYVVAKWGATGIGDMMAIVDVITGKVYPFPYPARAGFDSLEGTYPEACFENARLVL